MSVKTFDPAALIVTFAGIPISGFAPGTFVSIEHRERDYSLIVGADGEGGRTKSNDKSGTVTVTLMQTAAANSALSAFRAVGLLTNGDDVAPMLVKDLLGATLVAAPTAWIQGAPAAAFALEAQTREWVLETDSAEIFIGGN